MQMPKLVIRVFGNPGEEICELEEARCFLNFYNRIVVVEGKDIHSYAELVQVISQERFRDREFIEVVQVPPIEGG
jgi:hypothetical protein